MNANKTENAFKCGDIIHKNNINCASNGLHQSFISFLFPFIYFVTLFTKFVLFFFSSHKYTSSSRVTDMKLIVRIKTIIIYHVCVCVSTTNKKEKKNVNDARKCIHILLSIFFILSFCESWAHPRSFKPHYEPAYQSGE